MAWKLFEGDCLEIMPREIEDKSIDLIILDPPYNIKKAKWDKFKTHEDYLDFIYKVIKECERVLKDNGSLYIYHNQFRALSDFNSYIENNASLILKSLITINKTSNCYIKDRYGSQKHFRNFINSAEYLLFYTFQDETGLTTVKHDLNHFTSLRQYFKDFQDALGLSLPEINKRLGHRKAEHGFYWKSTQWDLPTLETYKEICKLPLKDTNFRIKGYEFIKREYEDLRQEYEDLRQEYEDLRYTFNENEGKENVWNYHFRTEKGYHPTQKPSRLSEDLVRCSSNKNDTVLIPFAGSGSEMIAAHKHDRNVIGIEKEPEYCDIIRERLSEINLSQYQPQRTHIPLTDF